jgi:hypothetical protein
MRTEQDGVLAGRKVVHAREDVRFDGRGVRIVAISDTHGRPHPNLGERIDELSPDLILHAGDVGELGIVRLLEKRARVIAVRGNVDERDLPDLVTIELSNDSGAAVRILMTHVALVGLKLWADVRRIARAEGASLVVCGHTHVPFVGRDGDIAVFNPGSVGPCRFLLPIVIGVIEVRDRDVSMRHVDCETGAPWVP